MSTAHYVCAAVCPPIANLSATEAGVMAAISVALLVSAFWPSRG